MDRIHQIQDEAVRSKDITLDTSSLPSESFVTANESSSSFYSLTEEDSTFVVSPTKDSSSTSNTARIADANLICNLSPIHKSNEIESFKIGKQIEAANILSGGVNIFDDNSYDGDELVIDDNPIDKELKGDENEDKTDDTLEAGDVSDTIPTKETGVVLQIDGKNVDAIDIGNGLYLYRKTGEEELAAVQIIDGDQQQQTFKFLKVRENAEGNLEVYEEIEIEVPKDAPIKKGKQPSTSKTTNEDVNKLNQLSNKVVETTQKSTTKDIKMDESKEKEEDLSSRDLQESKSELNFNGKTMKFSESRKSPVIGTFTPMTYHSTQNKEGRPLTKTMVDQHLQPNRHSDNIKKTIEVNTDNCKLKGENVTKVKDENALKNESTDDNAKDSEITECMSSTINDTVEMKHDDTISNETNKIDLEIENCKVSDKCTDVANDIYCKATLDNVKITPDAILPPIVSNNLKNTVKLINQDLCNDSESKQYNSTQAVVTLATDTLSDNTETDVEDKLVIAEDSLICDVSNEPITKPVDTNHLPGSITNSERIVSDLDSVLESCENIVKTIEGTKKYEKQESVVKEVNMYKNTENTNHEEEVSEKSKLKSKGKNLDDKVTLDSPQKHEICENNIIQTVEPKKDKPTIIEIEDSSPQSIPNKGVAKATTTHDVKTSANNNSGIEQTTENKSTNNEQIQKKPTSVSCSLNSHGLKTRKQPQLSTIKVNPSNELPIKQITEEKKDLNTGKVPENKATAKACPAVPFGKWTEANRQEFLNKIKESKVTTSNSHTKQFKQPNDLNRRDFLNKIDSQRQTNSIAAKNQDNCTNKLNSKPSPMVFKNTPSVEVATPAAPALPVKEVSSKVNPTTKPITEVINKSEIPLPIVNKLILAQRKEINNQDLIDKTIEGIINRALPAKAIQEEKQNTEPNAKEVPKSSPVTLDDIERKMNELHGIPFVERPSHELPGLESKLNDADFGETKMENAVVPYTNKHHKAKDSERANISDEEIIEHEPITGDIAITVKDKMPQQAVCNNGAKKESIITEKDFDKFARRNSVTYKNCLTVKYDKREPCHTQSIVSKDVPIKKMSRNELMLAESKAKSTHKQYIARHSVHSSKIPTALKSTQPENTNKHYQSKVQIAYQSALTAKQQQEPITINEDKPVKVVFLDTNAEFGPLNVQGQELSPSRKPTNNNAHSASESIDSDIVETISNQNKLLENRSKAKHQRKQVLTPVATPELELIEPKDLGLHVSPKKKRRADEKSDKKTKSIVPKKSYLLNRNIEDEEKTKSHDRLKIAEINAVKRSETYVVHSDPISAIDNLVKAAELLETQSENKIINSVENETKIEEITPIKRGRGRPRKYPLPGTESDSKPEPVSPQKEKKLEYNTSNSLTDTEDDSSDDEIIKENWTMGKINENILCPICNKLFRSENVVFKHVKHCTGPSPNRSDSDKRSSRRLRHSSDSKVYSLDSNSEDEIIIPRKRKSRDTKPASNQGDVIKTSKETTEKAPAKHVEKKEEKARLNSHVCELCGKTFRQLSYLLSHKLQHKREEAEKLERMKSVLSCEVCKKEFRKLHHLVQHRQIHDPKTMTARLSRKSSSETNENKQTKIQEIPKKREDHNTGFRCEPCDKSFRKLHHLVEHRETHVGINKKSTPNITDDAKTPTLHQCDLCEKTFKKLQHLMEHKDQHLETSSEKSDDKSVQSSLSTRDIIHECSLCYMVFPNEHSLNKHFVNCQRKKKQSKTGEGVIKEENKEDVDSETDNQPDNNFVQEIVRPLPSSEVALPLDKRAKQDTEETLGPICETEEKEESNVAAVDSDNKSDDLPLVTKKSDVADTPKLENDIKPAIKKEEIETIVIPDTPTPKKRTAVKSGITVTKKQRISVLHNIDKKVESSDEDDVRYMLNPDFLGNLEDKFMKVRAEKRSSLQIERPNSKDLVKRRISLQHPPKILRLKAKESRPTQPAVKKTKTLLKSAPSTDSDDSDVKYSFPKTVAEKCSPNKVDAKRKSINDKRKSLTGVAKRKSLGKQKINAPVKMIRRRAEVEHRCDCGQLFSSAALLSRHTTLAHTPPRIRKRRSPPPENPTPKQPKPSLKQPKQTLAQKTTTQKQTQKQTQVKKLRKSSEKPIDDTRKTAHRGVAEKSRKIK